MRGLSFYAHAVGTAAFPGLVLADGLGFSAPLGAFAAALVFAFGVERLARRAARGLRQPDRARAGRGAGRRRRARERRLPLRRRTSTPCCSAACCSTEHARSRARRRGQRGRASPRRCVLGPRWLATRLRPGRGARDGPALAAARRAPARARRVRGRRLAHRDRRAARDRAVRRARGHDAPVDAAPARLATGSVALAAAQGIAGLWLSVELNTPPGPTVAVLGGALFAASLAWHGLADAVRGRAALVAAAAALLALVLAACGGARRTGSSGPEVVATTTQIGDWTRAVGGDAARRAPDPAAQHRSARLRAAAGRRRGGGGREARVPERRSPRRLDGHRALERGRLAGRRRPRGEGAGAPAWPAMAEASRYDPHWWHDPRNAEAAVGAIRDALVAANPGAAATYRANAAAYLRRLRALDAGIRACLARVPAAQRKLVSDHDAFGYFAQRYGIAIVGAVIPSQTTQAQASAQDLERLIGADPPRARARRLPGELPEQEAGTADRARDGRTRRLHALRRHARPEWLGRRDVPLDGASQRGRHDARLHAPARAAAGSRASHDARLQRTALRSATPAGPCSRA